MTRGGIRRILLERERAFEEIGDLEALNAACRACGAVRGQRCYPGSRIHLARRELRSEELERGRWEQ
jgi:hypothetical protein